jgi:amino acid transporter
MTGEPRTRLRRSLGFFVLLMYGLGTIIGAGIYVLIGEVARSAGMAAPIAFLVAGMLTALTGLSYAELVARHPEAGGAAAFVLHGFRVPWLAGLTGIIMAAIAIVASASIACGGAEYFQQFIALDATLAAALIVVVFTVTACLNVGHSVGVAALISAIEIGGLLVAISIGAPALADLPARAVEIWPQTGGHGAGSRVAPSSPSSLSSDLNRSPTWPRKRATSAAPCRERFWPQSEFPRCCMRWCRLPP